MKYIFIIPAFFLILSATAQQSKLESLADDLCNEADSIHQSENISLDDSFQKAFSIMIGTEKWVSAKKWFQKKSRKSEMVFILYFEHLLRSRCKNYRNIEMAQDNYLEDTTLQTLYIEVKKFLYALEDDEPVEDLRQFFNDSLRTSFKETDLYTLKNAVLKLKMQSARQIVHTGKFNGFTFNTWYFNPYSNILEYQIEITFISSTDIKIDNIVIKNRLQLKKELRERKKFNKRVEKGGYVLPPPPGE